MRSRVAPPAVSGASPEGERSEALAARPRPLPGSPRRAGRWWPVRASAA